MTSKAMKYELLPGRNIVIVTGNGKSNADEIEEFTEEVLEVVADWKDAGWGYVADCSNVTPVSAAESQALIVLTRRFVEAGCKAFAFVEGKSFMIKIQAQKHTEQSHTQVASNHFKTIPEAIAWLEAEFDF